MRLRTIDLDCSQREALEMGHQQGRKARFRQRCQIILLKSQGRTAKDVGQIVGLSPISVNHWLNRYEAEGIDGLHTKPGRGRRPILDLEKDAPVVKAAVREERQRLQQAKAALEKELDKTFSARTLKRFLKNLAAPGSVSVGGPKANQTQNGPLSA